MKTTTNDSDDTRSRDTLHPAIRKLMNATSDVVAEHRPFYVSSFTTSKGCVYFFYQEREPVGPACLVGDETGWETMRVKSVDSPHGRLVTIRMETGEPFFPDEAVIQWVGACMTVLEKYDQAAATKKAGPEPDGPTLAETLATQVQGPPVDAETEPEPETEPEREW